MISYEASLFTLTVVAGQLEMPVPVNGKLDVTFLTGAENDIVPEGATEELLKGAVPDGIEEMELVEKPVLMGIDVILLNEKDEDANEELVDKGIEVKPENVELVNGAVPDDIDDIVLLEMPVDRGMEVVALVKGAVPDEK